MHVIVVGCGRVGSELAGRLSQEGHEVVIIDKRASSFVRLPDGWGGSSIAGTGIDRDVLEQAGVREAGALAAVTSGDNTNILVARIAREYFDVPRVVARIYDPRRALIYQRLGIPTVATVSWTVDQVTRRLLPEEVASAWTDPSGGVHMVERRLPDAFAGRPLADLASGEDFRPVMVTRAGQARLATAETMGQDGDVVLFGVRSHAFDALERRLGGGGAAAAPGRDASGGAAGGGPGGGAAAGGAAGGGAAGGGAADGGAEDVPAGQVAIVGAAPGPGLAPPDGSGVGGSGGAGGGSGVGESGVSGSGRA